LVTDLNSSGVGIIEVEEASAWQKQVQRQKIQNHIVEIEMNPNGGAVSFIYLQILKRGKICVADQVTSGVRYIRQFIGTKRKKVFVQIGTMNLVRRGEQ
jgi:hypothetical protein